MATAMDTFRELELALREALNHLHDPDYLPPAVLNTLAGCDPSEGPGPVQSAIIRTIEALRPAPDTPALAEAHRSHSILHSRYVLKLTLEETAERLSLSIRHLTRLQREAIHVLARHVWDRSRGRRPPLGSPVAGTAQGGGTRPRDGWRAQVQEELAVLERGEGEARTNLAAAIPRTLRIARALAVGRDITISANAAPPEPAVLCHPSALQHILLSLTHEMIDALPPGGELVWRTERVDDRMEITVSARPISQASVPALDLAQELLAACGGTLLRGREENRVSVVLQLPCEPLGDERIVVLSIDDNPGLASLFQSYCKGTRYQITHVREGRRALEAIASCHPQVILLDVLLPDVDGWALLLELRQDSLALSIPVILCSVTTDEQLALRLGADLYLPKPVWRRQLIDALDQVLNQSQGASAKAAPSTPEAC